MLLTPLSVPMGYSSPDGKGIYLKPTSDAAPSGWGEPRLDTSTEPPTPITPGTPGGPLERCLLRSKGGTYKAISSKYFQKAGNITWWGPDRNSQKQSMGRHVLSYNGPKLRYFREEGFDYGNSPEHNEIYYLGNYAAIAPGPVLGACMRKMNFYDPITQKTAEETFIIVAVYQDGMDKFYRKRWNYRVKTPFNLSDAVREKEMRMYDAAEEPYGWMLMGTFSRQEEAYPPETPWFFNKSGTAAACMRRNSKTFNNGNSDVTEDQFLRYQASVSESSVSCNNLGNLEPMQYSEKHTKEHPTYNQEADREGYPHSWQEDHVKVEIKLDGSQYVMCDYVDDELHYGKVKYQISRRQEGYYTKGTDPQEYIISYLGNDKNISNKDLRYGPRILDYIEYNFLDQEYIPEPADHERTTWIYVYEKITLYFGPESNPESNYVEVHYYDSGTSDEWAGNPRQDDNPYLYYYQFYTRWMRGFCDIRDLAFFAYDLHKYGLWQDQESNMVNQTEKHKDTLYTNANTSGEDKRSTKKTKNANSSFGWPIAEMDSWSETFNETLSRTTYQGAWPSGNESGQIQEPGSKSFYDNEGTGDYAADWPTIPKLFYSSKNACKGNGVVTEQQTLAYSLEVPDVENEGQYVVVSDTKPAGDPAGLVGYGTKFYPVGSC